MTKKQKRDLENISGYKHKKEIGEILLPYFANTKRYGKDVVLEIYNYLFTPPYTETKLSTQLMEELNSKEIIPFEQNSIKTVEVLYRYCNFTTDIVAEIISYTIAPCRRELLRITLKQ